METKHSLDIEKTEFQDIHITIFTNLAEDKVGDFFPPKYLLYYF